MRGHAAGPARLAASASRPRADEDVVAALAECRSRTVRWAESGVASWAPSVRRRRRTGRWRQARGVRVDRRGHRLGVDQAGQLELHQHHVDQRRHRRARRSRRRSAPCAGTAGRARGTARAGGAAGRPPAAAGGGCRGAGGGTGLRAWSAGRRRACANAARRGWTAAARRHRRWPARMPGCAVSSSMTSCSMSRKASSPCAAKKSRIGMPMRCSISVSLSTKRRPRCRARWRPTVDLPQPGMPTREMVTSISWCCCNRPSCRTG